MRELALNSWRWGWRWGEWGPKANCMESNVLSLNPPGPTAKLNLTVMSVPLGCALLKAQDLCRNCSSTPPFPPFPPARLAKFGRCQKHTQSHVHIWIFSPSILILEVSPVFPDLLSYAFWKILHIFIFIICYIYSPCISRCYGKFSGYLDLEVDHSPLIFKSRENIAATS